MGQKFTHEDSTAKKIYQAIIRLEIREKLALLL